MTAQVFVLPIVMRPNLGSPDWCEQRCREAHGIIDAAMSPPPRTRPLLGYSRRPVAMQFDDHMTEILQAFADNEGGC
jgi:hypothetical protein